MHATEKHIQQEDSYGRIKKTPPKYEVPVHTNAKGVYKITTSGEIIEEYASLLSAAKSNGVIASNISRSIKTGIKCGGFLWKYKEQNDRAGDLHR